MPLNIIRKLWRSIRLLLPRDIISSYYLAQYGHKAAYSQRTGAQRQAPEPVISQHPEPVQSLEYSMATPAETVAMAMRKTERMPEKFMIPFLK